MSNIKTGLLVVAVLVVAAAAGGVIGAGVAIALVRTSFNGPVSSDSRSELAVHSSELGESMVLRIRLPIGYVSNPDRRYPVLWVLDGLSQGEHVYSATQTLSRVGAAKPSIVVEVPSSGTGRTDDLTPPAEIMGTGGGRGDRYLRFLETEAIPAVEEDFRADSIRVLVGHSLGGLFVLYAFAEQPSLFDAYFAFSPAAWLSDEAIVPALERALRRPGRPEGFLYVSLGSDEGNEMRSGFEAVRSTLESHAPGTLTWHLDVTADADHITNPILSYPMAARRYWGD